MDLEIAGKVAVVCAASQGLGKATALALAQEGAHVVICSRDSEKITKASGEIRDSLGQSSVSVVPLTADLSRREDIERVFSTAREKCGEVDILVTNAGGPPPGEFDSLEDEQWLRGVDLTLLSVIRCIREVLPAMVKKKWGRIINITSLTAKQPSKDLAVSSVMRPAVVGLSKILANRHARDGITVNCVAPGFIMTSRQQELGRARAGKKGLEFEEYVREMSEGIPAGRFGTPQELASVIAFLASRKASYMNGTTVSVDGGLVKGLL